MSMEEDRVNRPGRPTAAVIGSGVAGLTAAHVLKRTHEVSVFESDARLGGHVHTHDVPGSDGTALRIDSGFIVHNERTYPTLLRLFSELDVATQPTEMSMSVTCQQCGLSYAGGRGLRGILAQPRRAGDPRFIRMLGEVRRFHRDARDLLETAVWDVSNDPPAAASGDKTSSAQCASAGGADPTWHEFLRAGGYSSYFVRHFAIPLVACVWSSGDGDAGAYPARHLFRFLDHHGMLSVSGSPAWRTVTGGAATYVERLVARLGDVRTSAPVTSVIRHDDGVDVRTAAGIETFDRVIVATHANQALDLLADATPAEKTALSAIRYSVNHTWLHRDSSLLPTARAARSSWNYRMASCHAASDKVVVSYWMNRLQGIRDDQDHIVTLNAAGHVDPSTVTAQMVYEHPIFTREAVAAATVLHTAGGERLAFAGAHLGWGFHEDGCRSGVRAAERVGATW